MKRIEKSYKKKEKHEEEKQPKILSTPTLQNTEQINAQPLLNEEEENGKRINCSREAVNLMRVIIDDSEPGGVTSNLLKYLRSSSTRTRVECAQASIFSPNDPNLSHVKRLVSGQTEFNSVEEERAFGIMYGMVVGDAIGSQVEFDPVDYEAKTLTGMGVGCGIFGLSAGQWTDDSSMGLCIADSLLVSHGKFDEHDCMHRFLSWWYCGYNTAFRLEKCPKGAIGLGGNISLSFQNYLKCPNKRTLAGDKNTSGNGSVMRNAAVPICFHDDYDTALEVACAQSFITHQGLEAAECCRLITHVAILAMSSTGNDRVRKVLGDLGESFTSNVPSVQALARSQMENNDRDRDWRWKTEDGVSYHYSPTRAMKMPGYVGSYAMDATAMALHCVWSTHSFTEAVLKAANMCGDADSVASVTGQIAGAFYGVRELPLEWIDTVARWDGYEIALRAYRLFHHIWWNESELGIDDKSNDLGKRKKN